MKKLILVLSICIITDYVHGQTSVRDSLKNLLQQEQPDTTRALLLGDLSFTYLESKPDTTMTLALEALSLSREIGFEKGEAAALNRIANVYYSLGNYPKSMETLLQALRINEKINNRDGIQKNNNNIGLIYHEQGEYRQALAYSVKAREQAEKINNKPGVSIALINIGQNYQKLKVYDSARQYTQQSHDVAFPINYSRMIATSLHVLGEIHYETGKNPLALEYYRLSIPYSIAAENDFRLTQTYLSIARVFEKTGQRDSALFYAKRSVELSKTKNFIKQLLDASGFLSSFYKNNRNADSAFFYLEVAKVANDSLFSQQKLKQLQSLDFDENLRQQEMEDVKLKEQAERKQNIQYAAIAFGLIVFIILFLLLSHSVIVDQRLIRFFGILALLIIFEFINLLLHPYLARITHHSPLLMLAIMVFIAALLIPIHHKLEKWITHRLVEKNKKIRLEAAKKTIAKLEGK